MSNKGTILLAVGMLVLGLILGLMVGGAAGFVVARGARGPVAQNFPFNNQPGQNFPPNQPGQNQPGQNFPPGGFPQFQNLPNGARVTDIEANSAADKAGMKAGDVITAVAGTKIDEKKSLADLVKTHKPGEKIDFAIMRGGQTMTLTVELGASPQDSTAAYLGIRYAPSLPSSRRSQ